MTYSDECPPRVSAPLPHLTLAVAAAHGVVAPSHPGAPLHLDCSAVPYRRTLGVCHQVSQLLLLRQGGFRISLHQANPVLRRCLRQLQVAHLFAWVA